MNAVTKTFQSGKSEAVRVPKDIGFGIDRMIAATALMHGLPLATLNPGDFADGGSPNRRLAIGLVLEGWRSAICVEHFPHGFASERRA
jgi:hypothetical protein